MEQYILYCISIFIVIISIPLSNYVSNKFVERNTNKKVIKRNNRLLIYLSFTIRMIILISLLIFAMKISNINTVVLLGTVGIFSLIIPLTLQIPIQDFACGILIQIFDKYRVGDYVMNDHAEGTVIQIKAFITEIQTLQGIIQISNTTMWRDTFVNLFREKYAPLKFEMIISNQNRLEFVENIIKRFMNKRAHIKRGSSNVIIYGNGDTNNGGQKIIILSQVERKHYNNVRKVLPKELYIHIQNRGVIFIDGYKPVSIDYRSNMITPIILDHRSQFD